MNSFCFADLHCSDRCPGRIGEKVFKKIAWKLGSNVNKIFMDLDLSSKTRERMNV